jgi:hypothetical protein
VDVLEQFAGAVLIVAGIAWICPPAALIVAGVLLAVHGTLRELSREDEDERTRTTAEGIGDRFAERDEAA